MTFTLLTLARRFLGLHEIPGPQHHPVIQWGFSLCSGFGPETPDEEAWCSAILQVWCEILGIPRSHSAAARSWLTVGQPIDLADAIPAYDVVVLKRPPDPRHGHVGIYVGVEADRDTVILLSGNHQNRVDEAPYPRERLLGVRRLWTEGARA